MRDAVRSDGVTEGNGPVSLKGNIILAAVALPSIFTWAARPVEKTCCRVQGRQIVLGPSRHYGFDSLK